jgi:hypothetical protein
LVSFAACPYSLDLGERVILVNSQILKSVELTLFCVDVEVPNLPIIPKEDILIVH